MPTQSNDRGNPEAPFGERPFRGWTWRGANLTDRQLAFFIPGRVVKHLGVPELRTGTPTAWPVHFAVYVHRGWRRGRKVALPANACFEVWAVLDLPGGGTCLALEQIEEGSSRPGSFRRSLERWLGRYPASLALPGETGRREQPFARWLPESRPGDPPLEGPIYDFEDAVRYASAWSGVEDQLTWRVLAAFKRYLEWTGIAQVEEDEALAREREQAMAWLPERPDVMDGRSEGYVAWATGIDRAAIAAVHRGEMAYLDHLGLVTWEYEGERAERLGTPAWPLAGASARAQINGTECLALQASATRVTN